MSQNTTKQTLPEGYRVQDYVISRMIDYTPVGATYAAVGCRVPRKVVLTEHLPYGILERRAEDKRVVFADDSLAGEEAARKAQRIFQDDALALRELDHPSIVPVYDVFRELGTVYSVTACVRGVPLEEWAAEPAHGEPAVLCRLLRMLLETLHYAHENGVYHGDLSPANIIMQQDGRPVITHFGMARHVIGRMVNAPTGTPGYTPEELLQNRGGIGPWSDLYALGAVFHRLLTGTRPPDIAERLMAAEKFKPLASRADLVERFGAEFIAGIDTAMQMDIARRWRSAAAWLAAVSPESSAAPEVAPEAAPEDQPPAIDDAGDEMDPEVQYHLGNCYRKGDGVKRDLQEAVRLYSLAAARGNAKAQYNLGLCYDEGVGVEKDGLEAAKWYRAAAEQGNARAQYAFALCYEVGQGVEKDKGAAMKWYRAAAEQGYAKAQHALWRLESS